MFVPGSMPSIIRSKYFELVKMKTKLRKIYLSGSKAGNIILRVLIATGTLFYLYDQLIKDKNIAGFNAYLSDISWDTGVILFSVFVILLLLVNILLESVKWKFLISKIEKVYLYNSIKAVLAGMSVSFVMPNRIGDYLGRVFILQKGDRLQAVLSTILGSISQLITTIIIGALGVIFYYPEYIPITTSLDMWLYIGVIMGVIMMIFIIVLSYLNFSVFSLILKRISGRYYKKISKYSDVFSWYSQKELLIVLLLSIGRYIVFTLQFYLLLHIFNVDTGYFTSVMLVSVVYLAMAIIPTVAITEIGVRGSVSLFVFQQHFELYNEWSDQISYGVVSASSILWLINIILPATIGAISVFALKFFRKRNGN
jgi:hypothetical protein